LVLFKSTQYTVAKVLNEKKAGTKIAGTKQRAFMVAVRVESQCSQPASEYKKLSITVLKQVV
jgi:hypothetical protein